MCLGNDPGKKCELKRKERKPIKDAIQVKFPLWATETKSY